MIPQGRGAAARPPFKQFPTDVAAIRHVFAEVAARLRRYDDAENLLTRLPGTVAPGFAAARHNYAVVSLPARNKSIEALRENGRRWLRARGPTIRATRKPSRAANPRPGSATSSSRSTLYDGAACRPPAGSRRVWMSYGHALKDPRTRGRQPSPAYDKSIEFAAEPR